ncbi:MAG: hypothetical protein N3J91_04245 [Verrucomicrobiae bacterium]|nr:hypothetical protein [Verrucomicrobiae bacterium]
MNDWEAVPLVAEWAYHPLRVCVLVRKQPDDSGEYFFKLRECMDGFCYLGCQTDRAGRILSFLEVWVQYVSRVQDMPEYLACNLNNRLLDEQWQNVFKTFKQLDPASVIETGFETVHPPGIWFSPQTRRLQYIQDAETGKPWSLCVDNQLLKQAGLPEFDHSLERFMYVPGKGEEPVFLALEEGGNVHPQIQYTSQLIAADFVPFNPQGGFMFCRLLRGVALEHYLDFLSGKLPDLPDYNALKLAVPTAAHLTEGVDVISQPECSASLNAGQSSMPKQTRWGVSHAFLHQPNTPTHLIEVLYLKLCVMASALRIFHDATRIMGAPFLNISLNSLRLGLNSVNTGLPLAWTAHVTLARAGQARIIKIGDAAIKHFIRTGVVDASDFVPADIGSVYSGMGSFSVVNFEKRAHDGKCVVEGVLRLPEKPISSSSRDLLFLTLSANNRKLNLLADIDLCAPTATTGHWSYQVTSKPQSLAIEWEKLLGKPGGSFFPQARIRLLPNLGSGYDLYACGLLCLRCLLAHDSHSLFSTLEHLHNLAEEVSKNISRPLELSQRIHHLLEEERNSSHPESSTGGLRWLSTLGPHRLLVNELDIADAANATPLKLWSRCLALALRLFPGLVPESYARDFGDGDIEAPELIYRQPLEDLDKIMTDTRRLLLNDWTLNREVHQAITALLGHR